MNSITSLSSDQLRHAADIREQIDRLQNELEELLGAPAAVEAPVRRGPGRPPKLGGRKRKLSAQGLANIRAGVLKRMGQQPGETEITVIVPKRKKRNMSPAARARLSAMAKARWKRAKASGKSRL